jgi:hypothetical protein
VGGMGWVVVYGCVCREWRGCILDGGKARKFEKRAQGWQGPGSSEVFRR